MEATGRSMAQLKKELEVTGDMGSVAAASRGSQRTMMAPKRLTVQSVRVHAVVRLDAVEHMRLTRTGCTQTPALAHGSRVISYLRRPVWVLPSFANTIATAQDSRVDYHVRIRYGAA